MAHDLVKKKANMTVGQRITTDMSSTNIESIIARRQSTDARNIAVGGRPLNGMGSTENMPNDLILSKEETTG